MSCYVMLCRAMLYCGMPLYSVICCSIMWYAVLCCVVIIVFYKLLTASWREFDFPVLLETTHAIRPGGQQGCHSNGTSPQIQGRRVMFMCVQLNRRLWFGFMFCIGDSIARCECSRRLCVRMI